jgi:hypothetical protein
VLERITPPSHLLLPSVAGWVWIFAVEFPTGGAPEFPVELPIEFADRARAKTVPAEFFADRFDFPNRYALGNSELEFS